MMIWKNGDYTRIALHAQHIADAANVAYWTRDKQPTVTAMKEDDIVEDFKAMAKLLGFELKRIEEWPALTRKRLPALSRKTIGSTLTIRTIAADT